MANFTQQELLDLHVGLDVGLPKSIVQDQCIEFVDDYMSKQEVPENASTNLIEELKMRMSEDGDITLLVSDKISNLIFKFGELIAETLSELPNLLAASGGGKINPLLCGISIFNWVRKVNKLKVIQIQPGHGFVVLAIHKLNLDNEIPTVDKVLKILGNKAKELDVPLILDELETLRCITSTMGEIKLNEKIVVMSK